MVGTPPRPGAPSGSPADDDAASPAPLAPGMLFQIMYAAGAQPVGAPTNLSLGPVEDRIRLEFSPDQVMLLSEVLTPKAVRALMLVIKHGYRPGERIEITGWGGQWLRDHGMKKYESEHAAKELREKGYIRTENLPGMNRGKQVGIVPSGIIEEVEDPVGDLRRDGRPEDPAKREKRLARQRGTLRAVPAEVVADEVSRPPGGQENTPGQPVDNSVSWSSGNMPSGSPGSRDLTDVFSQVDRDSRTPRNLVSTAPTSSEFKVEEDLLLYRGSGRPLPRPDLSAFLGQRPLRERLTVGWELAVANVARVLVNQSSLCGDLLHFLGVTPGDQPSTRLASMIVDWLRSDGAERIALIGQLENHLRAAGVRYKPVPPDEFLSILVVGIFAAVDQAGGIRQWGGWFGRMFKEQTYYPTASLTWPLGIFTQVLDGTLLPGIPVNPRTDPVPEHTVEAPSSPTGMLVADDSEVVSVFSNDDEAYVARLREAAAGHQVWGDEVMFDKLLRNPGQQQFLLERWEKRQAREG